MKIYEPILKKRIVGIVGSVSSGKTNTMIDMLEYSFRYKTDKVVYFYHDEYKKKYADKVQFVNSLEQLEGVQNSFIFVDEFLEFFKLNDRHSTEVVKKVLSMVEHNNNVLVLCGLPEYFKKYISSNIREWLVHKLKFSELIGGSDLKRYIKTLSGDFIGGTRIILRAGEFYSSFGIYRSEYKKEFDKKADNFNLFEKKVKKGVQK